MTINRTVGKSGKEGIAYLMNQVTGDISILSTINNRKIFNVGGGPPVAIQGGFSQNGHSHANQGVNTNPGFGSLYGDWTIIPIRTFEAQVKCWGAGGGAHSHGTERTAGGGGFSSATIIFEENIPYTIWVGQGGFHGNVAYGTNANRYNYRTNGTFGNGGGAGYNGGSGGGLSGIFYNTFGNDAGPGGGHGVGYINNTDVGGVATIFRSPGQQNALIIAGGGGGQGSTGSHANGGGGGGTTGNNSHNGGGGSQTAGGNGGYNSAQAGSALHGGFGGISSHAGGGGGGWFGGGGGGHSGSHHDGGGGGSGHVLDLHSTTGYRNFWLKTAKPNLVSNGYTETAIGRGNNVFRNIPAGRDDPDWGFAGIGAGPGELRLSHTDMYKYGNWNQWVSGTNGRVVVTVRG